MDVTVGDAADRNRKRRFQTELLGPLPKHVRRVQRVEYTSPPDSSKKLNLDYKIFAKRSESDPESAKDSNSTDSYISEEHDEAKAYTEYPKASASDEPSISTSSWDGTNPYSLGSRSLATYSCSKSGSVSISEENDYPLHGFTLLPSLNYEEYLSEFGNHDDCCSSEYKTDEIEYSTDKELENMLYSSGAAPSDYVLSSGRWSVGQDTQQVTRKPTIDKEFEQYFSTLML